MKNISRSAIIRAIVIKDLREFSRDRLWMILTPLTIAFAILIFWLLPDKVNEKIKVGIYPTAFLEMLMAMEDADNPEENGMDLVPFKSKEILISAVSGELVDKDKDVSIGIAFPEDFATGVLNNQKSNVTIYTGASVPSEISQALSSAVREIAYGLQALAAGEDPEKALPVISPDKKTVILGEDRAGVQVPIREKLRPMLIIVILMIESLALSGLVAIEIEEKTVTALLVTPVRTSDLLAAKSITGAFLALLQGLLFVVATQSFGQFPLLVLCLLILGAIMFTSVGMISGAAGKDFMSTLFYGIIFLIPLMIPAIATMFPGSPSLWIKVLPSYGLIEAMFGTIGYSRGWNHAYSYIGMMICWDVLLFVVALVILKRKVEAL